MSIITQSFVDDNDEVVYIGQSVTVITDDETEFLMHPVIVVSEFRDDGFKYSMSMSPCGLDEDEFDVTDEQMEELQEKMMSANRLLANEVANFTLDAEDGDEEEVEAEVEED